MNRIDGLACTAAMLIWTVAALVGSSVGWAQIAPCAGVQHIPCDTDFSEVDGGGGGFGVAAMTSRRAVVGRNSDNGLESGAGSIFVYHRIDGTWNFAAKIEHPDPDESEHLGNSVAIDDIRIVAAAPGRNQNRGRLLVFDLDLQTGEWQWTMNLVVPPNVGEEGDLLGGDATAHRRCVAVSGDIIVGGAPYGMLHDLPPVCDEGPIEGGYVAAFVGQQEFVLTSVFFGACPMHKARFGAAVVLDDDRLAIGEPGRGRVYLARFESGSWISEGFVIAPGGGGDGFGWDIALDGRLLAVGDVGALSVHFYEMDSGGVWQFQQSVPHPEPTSSASSFGKSVALSGSLLLVGDDAFEPGGAETGQYGGAFLFQRNASGNWVHVRTFVSGNSFVAGYGSILTLNRDEAIVGTIKEHYDDGQVFIPGLGGAFFYRSLPGCDTYDPPCGGP